MAMFDYIVGDTGSTLVGICRDRSEAVIDLTTYTSATLIYEIIRPDGSKATFDEKTMTVTDATAGKVSYTFLAYELEIGTGYAQIRLLNGSGGALTSRRERVFTVGRRIQPKAA